MKIAIIGGGIAGLSAAWELEKHRRSGVDVEYRVFEREQRLGGVIRTERLADGSILESGPDSFLTEKPWAAALCGELGLANQLIGSNDASRRTFIVVRNRLCPLPDGLQFFVPTRIAPIATSPLFSAKTKLRFVCEYLSSPRKATAEDEPVSSFVERHFGREVVERLADPLLSGIYGGTADQLSVRAVLPRMAQMEAEHGSLIRAMLRARKNALRSANPLFTTLRDGMQQLTDAVAAQLNSAWLRTGAGIDALEFRDQQWHVRVGGSTEAFDAVILAVPAWAAADLLQSVSANLAVQLAAIPYTSSITVNLAFDTATVGNLPAGFGFLVPRLEHRKMLACTFVQNKFPHRAPPGRLLFRCFFTTEEGQRGSGHPRPDGSSQAPLLDLCDEDLSAIAAKELREILGITAAPDVIRISRWRHAMPQYAPGHLDHVTEIESLLAELPGLALAGNYLGGIGVPDCVRAGAEAAQSLVTWRQPRAAGGV